MPGERILIIEDEARIAQFVERGLIYEGYRVNVARDGHTGLQIARDNPPDLVILDWMLPGLDGLEVCKRLRAASEVPIVMLTAKDDVKDRVKGLDAGADDYLVKPFSIDELMARVRAQFRRVHPTSRPEVLRFADLTLDTGTHRAHRGERAIDLTAKEYELLELFMRHPRQVLTHDQIEQALWEWGSEPESNAVTARIKRLRQRLRPLEADTWIETIYGTGYRFEPPAS